MAFRLRLGWETTDDPVRRFRTRLSALLSLSMLAALLPLTVAPAFAADASVHISEVHYDNVGGDVGEFIEVSGNAGVDLGGWSVVLYNGSSTQLKPYATISLSGVIDDEGAGIGAIAFPHSGIQNGSPDGFALVDDTAAVVEFLSYEGTFTPGEGPALGMESDDLEVAESSSTPVGQSLQLLGDVWTAPSTATAGWINGTDEPEGGEPGVAALEITGAHDGPLSGGVPKFVEFTATDDIADLSAYGFGSANNGGGTDGEEFTFPAVALASGESYCVASNESGMLGYFGAAAQATSSAALVNGDDAVELFFEGGVIDTFGDIDVDGNGEPWEYLDGWAQRAGGSAGAFVFGDWAFSGRNALDGLTFNPEHGDTGHYHINCVGDDLGPIGTTALKIHEIQGSGSSSPKQGDSVEIQGVVVGDFQTGGLRGFHVQEENSDTDANDLTSEGIFVFYPFWVGDVEVALGDVVTVVGQASERFGLTQISADSVVVDLAFDSEHPELSPEVTPAELSLPLGGFNLETVEGMSVHLGQSLVIAEYFNYDRFGEMVLTTERAFTPTATYNPGTVEAPVAAALNADSRITLDDGQTAQNPFFSRHPNGLEFTSTNYFRGGDTLTDVVGVLDYSFGNYKIQPTGPATYTVENPRPVAPASVGGNLTVATFNVLNYFSTIDDRDRPVRNICGPNADQGCRGADNDAEFERQRTKIIAAIVAINADVVGLMEIENHATDEALIDLVDGLNGVMGAGTYARVDSGVPGDDVIKVAFIYKPESVSTVGPSAVLDTPDFIDPLTTGRDRTGQRLLRRSLMTPQALDSWSRSTTLSRRDLVAERETIILKQGPAMPQGPQPQRC